jgi:hypothetical protein
MAVGLSVLPRRSRFTSKEDSSYWVDAEATVLPEEFGKLKKSNDLNANRTRDLPTCSIVPQPNKYKNEQAL